MGRGEAQQLGNLILVGEVFRHTLFEDLAKFSPESCVFLRFLLCQLLQYIEHPLGQGTAHGINRRVFLQYLP